MVFDPLRAYRVVSEDGRKRYERWIGKPLCVVGEYNPSILLLTPAGEMYSVFEDQAALMGTTIEESLETFFVSGRRGTRIPMPEELIPPKPDKPELPTPPPEGRNFGIRHNDDWRPKFQTFTLKGIDFEMCKVPPGSFQMGSNQDYRSQPSHYQYMTDPYWIGVYPITNSQWKQVVTLSDGKITEPKFVDWYNDPEKSHHAVALVNWYQCQDFANWLGKGWGLPTEREWEYAARGPDNLLYPFGNEFDESLIAYGSRKAGPVAVGERPDGASWVGAQDMSGTVLEWTSSIYKEYPYNMHDGREKLKGMFVSVALRGKEGFGRLERSPRDPYYSTGLRLCFTTHDEMKMTEIFD